MSQTPFTFHHVALKCKDLNKSVAFYQALGMTEYARWGAGESEIVLMDLGGGGKLELFANGGDAYPQEGKYAHIALESHQIEEDYAKALAAGGTPMTPPKFVPLDSKPTPMTLHLAFVQGPDGEEVEFIEALLD